MFLGLFYIIAVILIAGVLLWGLNQFPAIDATIKQVVKVLVIVVVCIIVIWFLYGIVTSGGGVPRFHP